MWLNVWICALKVLRTTRIIVSLKVSHENWLVKWMLMECLAGTVTFEQLTNWVMVIDIVYKFFTQHSDVLLIFLCSNVKKCLIINVNCRWWSRHWYPVLQQTLMLTFVAATLMLHSVMAYWHHWWPFLHHLTTCLSLWTLLTSLIYRCCWSSVVCTVLFEMGHNSTIKNS